jgi:hypothetical protein
MSHDKDQNSNNLNTTDPQDNEKDGNVFGKPFDKLTGDSRGDKSMSEEESKKPGNQESIKDTNS